MKIQLLPLCPGFCGNSLGLIPGSSCSFMEDHDEKLTSGTNFAKTSGNMYNQYCRLLNQKFVITKNDYIRVLSHTK